MQRPSVLFINRVYPPVRGSTGRLLRDLARGFAQEGWQVTVVTTGPKVLKERDGGVRVIRIKGPEKPANFLIYGWVWIRLLITVLRLPKTHLLITMSDPPLLILAGKIIKRWKKTRHIHWCHDLYPDILPVLGFRIPAFMMKFFQRLTYKAMLDADKVVVIGRCMARHLAYGGMDPRSITMIPNWPEADLIAQPGKNTLDGVSMHTTKVNGAKPYEAQLKDGPKFRVLYAGNLGRAHPIGSILGAAEILGVSNPEIEFVFVGDGPRFDEIARERSRRALDNIRLLPYQPQSRLRELMESGDIHLISIKDSAAGMLVPSKLYAALAVQRPCIFVGPVGSEVAKVITDYHAGVIVPQGKAKDLAAQILHFRMNGEDWFAAHQGAATAGNIFLPKESIEAWMQRAWVVVEQDLRNNVSGG